MQKLWHWDSREHGWYLVGDKAVFGPLPEKAKRPPPAQMYNPLREPGEPHLR